ncbi:MAG: hypothetical protein OXI38_07710, partial [Bacteroidota bacterium]|nr:hypothetical protein [Bacteroidota bacterium]
YLILREHATNLCDIIHKVNSRKRGEGRAWVPASAALPAASGPSRLRAEGIRAAAVISVSLRSLASA